MASRGGNYLCTWNTTEQGTKTSGLIFVSDGKFSADFQTVSDNSALNSHLMGDGKTLYSWSDFTDVPGVTLSYDKFKSPGSNNEGLIYKKLDYACSPWKPDLTRFTLPKNIKFQ